MRYVYYLCFTLATLSLIGNANAEEKGRSDHLLIAYGKIGGLVPVNKLGPNATYRIGLGYGMPFNLPLGGRLALALDLGYAQTSSKETRNDSRLGDSGGQYSLSLTQHDLNLFLGPQYFIMNPKGFWVPHFSVGADLHFLKSEVSGSFAENNFGGNEEVSTKVGLAVRTGLGLRLGPGLAGFEINYAWAPMDHLTTGDSALSQLSFLAGYTCVIGL